MAVFLCFAAPLPSPREIYNIHPEILGDYKTFIQTVRKKASPISENCFTTEGAPWAVKWTRELYLPQTRQSLSPDRHCQAHYHLFFETGFDQSQKLTPPQSGHYRQIFDDGQGRHLFELVQTPVAGLSGNPNEIE
jgi:hypothetical protein